MSLKSNPISRFSRIRVGITIGDPAGIGPAITLKAAGLLSNKAQLRVIGDASVLEKTAMSLKVKPAFSVLDDLHNVKKAGFSFGRASAVSGRASLDYLDAASELLKNKQIDCLVTCPISKEAISLAGSRVPGHTEYLADKFRARNPVMMLLNDKLRFSLVTRHIALKDVSRSLSVKGLKDNILGTVSGLQKLFLIGSPRIVVCGINPHASDNGLIGCEEKELIAPALKALGRKGVGVTGPLPSDVAISETAKGNFDCVIALYHDQALIPLKLAGFDSGVNLTLGLPFVRTSPLHGTAFDLAFRPSAAQEGSLVASIKLAIECTLNLRKA